MTSEWAANLESIGVNLLDRITCQMRSYWSNLYENEICAVSAPTETTSVNGYGYHVVAGGKETCGGDFGTPLLCDIDGDVDNDEYQQHESVDSLRNTPPHLSCVLVFHVINRLPRQYLDR